MQKEIFDPSSTFTFTALFLYMFYLKYLNKEKPENFIACGFLKEMILRILHVCINFYPETESLAERSSIY